jgi:hypothetical protein
VTYTASLLKKRSGYTLEQLREIHEKAMLTLVVLTANLIQGDTHLDHILHYYKEPSVENVTRLLVRCKKMYEARSDVKKILVSLVICDDLLKHVAKDSEEQCLQALKKAQGLLSSFKHENKMFR